VKKSVSGLDDGRASKNGGILREISHDDEQVPGSQQEVRWKFSPVELLTLSPFLQTAFCLKIPRREKNVLAAIGEELTLEGISMFDPKVRSKSGLDPAV
jgi:hypothetical protein